MIVILLPSPHITISTCFCRRSMLMRPDGSAFDYLDVTVIRCSSGVHLRVPHARSWPAGEAVVACRLRFRHLGRSRRGAPSEAPRICGSAPPGGGAPAGGAPPGLFGNKGAITRQSKLVKSCQIISGYQTLNQNRLALSNPDYDPRPASTRSMQMRMTMNAIPDRTRPHAPGTAGRA
jgi:hypothetical protein